MAARTARAESAHSGQARSLARRTQLRPPSRTLRPGGAPAWHPPCDLKHIRWVRPRETAQKGRVGPPEHVPNMTSAPEFVKR
jgi:hypothetical protein